jgi:hypothetical protein
MATEWQVFIDRRFNEDLRLLQEFFAAKTSEDVWNAWCRFWQKAAEDYNTEYAAIAKRATDLMSCGVGTGVADTMATQYKAA